MQPRPPTAREIYGPRGSGHRGGSGLAITVVVGSGLGRGVSRVAP
jgi:hypothetical protein